MEFLNTQGFEQTFVSLQPYGVIHKYLEETMPYIGFTKRRNKTLNLKTGVNAILKLHRKESKNLIFSIGHPTSFIAAIASYFLNFSQVISHMQQPGYFRNMQLRWKRYLHQLIYGFYVRRANMIHSLSSEVKEHLLNQGISENKLFSVYIGVDFEQISRQLRSVEPKLNRSEEFYKILMVGRLAPEKNYYLALEAFSLLQRAIPNVKLLIAGEGPMGMDLKNFVKELNLENKIDFLGYVENIPVLLKSVDLFLHVATTEGYGQVYLESLLCGTPILSSRTGVSIDLARQFPKAFYVLSEFHPKTLCELLFRIINEKPNLHHEEKDLYEILFEHEIGFVFQRISKSFEIAIESNA